VLDLAHIFTPFLFLPICQNINTKNNLRKERRQTMLNEHYPNKLCVLRRQHGLSQKQVAALFKQDRGTISMYERGKTLPTLASAAMFELLYGLSIAEIFPGLFKKMEKQLEESRQRLRLHLKRRPI
jgi:ribosome-binding protein aMBF1 (putative translation factor)